MKVLVLSHMFPRYPGDFDGVFIHEQVSALRRRGVDARVLVGNPEGFNARLWRSRLLFRHLRYPLTPRADMTWQDVDGVPTLYFRYPAPYQPHWGKGGAFFYAREARRAALEVRPTFDFDVVHTHTAFLDGMAGLMVARDAGRPCVITEHTGPFSSLTATPAMRWQTQWALNHSDLVIAVSQAQKEEICKRVRIAHPERIMVIGNGMRSDIFRMDGTMPADDGTVKVLWVGGMQPIKQLPLLLEAYASAQKARPQLRLTLAGSGPEAANVDALIAARGLGVARLPTQSRLQVADLLRRHHFVVVSSATESFSVIVIEALGCGRPVLSTRCGGPQDTITGPQLGLLVENSVEGLTQGLIEMTDRMAEFNPEDISRYAHERYGIDTIAARVNCALEKLIR